MRFLPQPVDLLHWTVTDSWRAVAALVDQVSCFNFIQMKLVSCRKNTVLQNPFPKHGKQGQTGVLLAQPAEQVVQIALSWVHYVAITRVSQPAGRREEWATAEGYWNPECWAACSQHRFADSMSAYPITRFASKMNSDVIVASYISVIKVINKLDRYSNVLEFHLSF